VGRKKSPRTKTEINLSTALVSTGTEKEIPSVHPGWYWFTAASVKMEAVYNRKWRILLRNGKSC